MAFSTVLDTKAIEETKKLIEGHTAIIIGNIAQDNNTYNSVERIVKRASYAKDADSTIAAIRSYFNERMSATVGVDLRDRALTHAFMQTSLALVDWYAVLSYVTEIIEGNNLDTHPF